MARKEREKQEHQQPVLRPAFLPDIEQEFVQRFPDDEIFDDMEAEERNLYPDSEYETEDVEENLYPDAFGAPVYTEQTTMRRSGKNHVSNRKKSQSGLWTLIAIACVICLIVMGKYVYQLRKPYKAFCEKVKEVNGNTFAQGVYVDDIHIGGLTREQAYQLLMDNVGEQYSTPQISMNVQGIYWLTGEQLVVTRNLNAKLDQAYAYGRQISKEVLLSDHLTPFEYRYRHRLDTQERTVKLFTDITYDPQSIRELVRNIAVQINRDAQDAQVVNFDYANRQFTYTDEVIGQKVDEEALYNELIGALNRDDYQAYIPMNIQQIFPNTTRGELMNNFGLISSYTTETTSDQRRNNNINLAAQAVMETVVYPGMQFSFNQATGQRTTEKGYLPAAAIAGGTTVDEVGGGVCQVSSTLFNAAVMADMTIVERAPHTWPSNYVDKGRDATVNWPNLDFVFRNDRNTPIFIVAYYQNRKCTVEIYGASLGPGEGRDMTSVVIDVTEPPNEPIRNFNPELPWGTEKEVKKARTGYVVETYKIYTRSGQEYKRERICTSTYRVIQQVIDYNY